MHDGVLSLTWLGHSTVVIDLGGQRLLTDPLLLRHNGLLRRRGPVPEQADWRGTDAVLLSHLHHDHAELRSLRLLPDVPVLTSDDNARWLRKQGLGGLAAGDWTDVGDVRVRLVRAVHHGRPMPHRPNDANGHLVRAGSTAVWVAGDTALHDEMGQLCDQAGVERLDVVLVPIGGWGPRLSANHMGPAEAAEACAVTRARFALPVHWGTLHPPLMTWMSDWLDRPLDAFVDEVAVAAPECEVIRLPLGQTWSLPADRSR
ncbi:MBL fold metallo-hydrolase [Nocardioides sp. GXQ0305]|uniref:MBL fold metallo-hydrolase n=1 Tax=Nocardioides sp. GXQ0305 TaxID=3423912 RepID=UPI003D7E8314